jgi:hypothetical protein
MLAQRYPNSPWQNYPLVMPQRSMKPNRPRGKPRQQVSWKLALTDAWGTNVTDFATATMETFRQKHCRWKRLFGMPRCGQKPT